jgi:hypothetical protein
MKYHDKDHNDVRTIAVAESLKAVDGVEEMCVADLLEIAASNIRGRIENGDLTNDAIFEVKLRY